MEPVAATILRQVRALPEGTPISARGLLHLGSRAAIDQALSRLEKGKELMRLFRGVYVRPVETRFGTRAPAPEKVVAGLAATHAETVVPHGAAAANALGLTTQVPAKVVYLTSGKSRQLTLGAEVVEMKHAPPWLLLPNRAAGEAVRALFWIGEERAPEALTQLKKTLPRATLDDLVALRPALPAWMSRSISRTLAPNG
jgi:hypothetical protein